MSGSEGSWWDDLLGGVEDLGQTGVDLLKGWADYENFDFYNEWRQNQLTDPYGSNSPILSGYNANTPADFDRINSGLSSQQLLTYGAMAIGALLLFKAIQ